MRDPLSVAWNLFLAIIPVVLGFLVASVVREARKQGRAIPWLTAGPILFLWLIFLPNTCYLLTEWRHYLETVAANPMAFYSVRHNEDALFSFLIISLFYIFYSIWGMTTFFLSIWPVDRTFKVPIWGRALFFLLCSLGVYLGLIKRFNSWQVLRHSGLIFQSTLDALSRPELDLLIFGFAAVLWLAYVGFEVFMDGLTMRYPRLFGGDLLSKVRPGLWLALDIVIPIIACAIMWGQLELYQRWRNTGHGAPYFLGGPLLVAAMATLVNIPLVYLDFRKESRMRAAVALTFTVCMWLVATFMGQILGLVPV